MARSVASAVVARAREALRGPGQETRCLSAVRASRFDLPAPVPVASQARRPGNRLACKPANREGRALSRPCPAHATLRSKDRGPSSHGRTAPKARDGQAHPSRRRAQCVELMIAPPVPTATKAVPLNATPDKPVFMPPARFVQVTPSSLTSTASESPTATYWPSAWVIAYSTDVDDVDAMDQLAPSRLRHATPAAPTPTKPASP